MTLSNEQLELTRRRIAERGLGDRVRVELQDYRTLDGQFDKISSIGMFEHVGFDHHDDYFATIRRLLVDRGLYLHHAITRPGKSDVKTFRRKRTEYQAIIRYIFPGAELDHIGWTATKLEANGFEVHDVEGWREHYARTTELWARNLIAQRAEAEALVGPEKTRLWILYLAGVSLGFASGSINIFPDFGVQASAWALRPAADPRAPLRLTFAGDRGRWVVQNFSNSAVQMSTIAMF